MLTFMEIAHVLRKPFSGRLPFMTPRQRDDTLHFELREQPSALDVVHTKPSEVQRLIRLVHKVCFVRWIGRLKRIVITHYLLHE